MEEAEEAVVVLFVMAYNGVTTCTETTRKRYMATFTSTVNEVHLGLSPLVANGGGQGRKAKAS